MIDLITYIPNVEEFRAEAQANAENNVLGFSIDDEGNLSYDVGKIPVFYHVDGKRTLSLIRLLNQDEVDVFDSLDTCQKIGVCENGEYIFDVGGQEIYDSVYDRTAVEITDTDGNVRQYTPPTILGIFA
jgi:hypothetical protein